METTTDRLHTKKSIVSSEFTICWHVLQLLLLNFLKDFNDHFWELELAKTTISNLEVVKCGEPELSRSTNITFFQ